MKRYTVIVSRVMVATAPVVVQASSPEEAALLGECRADLANWAAEPVEVVRTCADVVIEGADHDRVRIPGK